MPTKTSSENSEQPRYVPAAGREAFARLYDPVLALTVRERRFRGLLQTQVIAELPQKGTLVDVGSGTGTFAIALAQARPDAEVTGIDGDPNVLRIAEAKAGGDSVSWHSGLADDLALADASTDAVVMSLVLHHLATDVKRAALLEAFRILRPGGRLHIADWGRPHGPGMRAAFFALQLLDGFANTRDHARGALPGFVHEAGFRDVAQRARLRTMWGTLELIEAQRG